MIPTPHGQTTPHGTTEHGHKPLVPQSRLQPTSTPHNNHPPRTGPPLRKTKPLERTTTATSTVPTTSMLKRHQKSYARTPTTQLDPGHRCHDDDDPASTHPRETESVEETTTIGDYMASLVPDRYSTALICVHDITMSGHTVIFTNTATIVEDFGGRYSIHVPRTPTSREWRIPLNLLHRLTTLRPHRDTAAPGPNAHRMTSTATPPDK